MSLLNFELDLSKNRNFNLIGGIDEVGRGCLAGPLVTAIVVIDIKNIQNKTDDERFFENIEQIKDSKKLSEKKRKFLSDFIKNKLATFFHIQEITNNDIDKLGISKATNQSFLANYNEAIKKHNLDYLITDAFSIKEVSQEKQLKLVKGDNTSLCVASASIIAKVYRDELMTNMAKENAFQAFSFAIHKGYGTAKHLEEIRNHGITSLHRKSFEPIKSKINFLTLNK